MMTASGSPGPFSGSYDATDVIFLLRPVAVEPLPVVEKEHRLLSGGAHYAEMLPEESVPDVRWNALVDAALERHALTMGRLYRQVAHAIATAVQDEIVLVSLARAGTPTGVVLQRMLTRECRSVVHYSISLVLQRGIDTAALDFIRARHADESIVFIDGWTGKGTIARELEAALEHYRAARGSGPRYRLAVLSDLAGVATIAGNHEDILIPHALLGAVGSGLISRTLFSSQLVSPGQFHACRYYEEWLAVDRSRELIDHLMRGVDASTAEGPPPPRATAQSPAEALRDWLRGPCPDVPMSSVKPGVCESLRAMMRRTPELLLVRNRDVEDVVPLLHLADRAGTPVRHAPDLPCIAATIIRAPRA